MNHLGDTNKMVGETPRTDEAQFGTGRVSVSFARTLERELNAANERIEALNRGNANAERILCELTGCESGRDIPDWIVAAKDRIPLLIAERDTARLQADRNYKLREEFRELLGTDDVEQGVAVVRDMKQRIKRLEEAGDGLEYASVILEAGEDPNAFEKLLIAQREWNKAKEAKPRETKL